VACDANIGRTTRTARLIPTASGYGLAMNVAVERETKLDADLDFTLPDLRQVVPRATVLQPQRLWSTYLDSGDLRLWAEGITLRHRRGEDEGPGVWTLKLPIRLEASRTVRSEHTWVGTQGSVPTEAREILVGVLRRQPLKVVAELECTRRRIALNDENGKLIGEIDDDTVTVHGGHQDGLRFHEVELETAAGDDRVRRVLDRLVEAGARPGSGRPKLGRALGQTEGEDRPRGGRQSTVEDVLRRGIESSLCRLVDHDYRLRLDLSDPAPESIHQARVASRRLRSDLKTVGDVLDPVWLRHTRDDLQWLGSALGEVRDCDVLADYLAGERGQGSVDAEGLAVLVTVLRKERVEACRGVARVLGTDRYLTLLDRLHAAAANPPVVEPSAAGGLARDVLPPLVATQWSKLRKAVHRAERRPTDRHLHKVRIRAKQLRYVSELLSPAIGKRARSTARAAKHLQTLLGHHQDAVVARQWLRRQAEAGPGIVGFAAGQLATGQQLGQLKARAGWMSRWQRLDRAKRRRWLTSSSAPPSLIGSG
jgi:CHAD domain-containing protein